MKTIFIRRVIIVFTLAFTSAGSIFNLTAQDIFPYVPPLSWSPDGQLIARVTNYNVEVREATSMKLLHVLTGHTGFIPMVAWSSDSRMIAAPSYDQTVKLWNVVEGTLVHTLIGHNDSISMAIWSPDNTKLISFGIESRPNLFIWNTRTGNLLMTDNTGSIVDASFSPNGQMLALITPLSLTVMNSDSMEILSQSLRTPCCANQMYTIAWNPDSTLLATGSINGLVTLWDAQTARIISQFMANPHYQPDSRDVDNLALSWVRDVTFLDDNQIIAVSGDGTIKSWNVETGEVIAEHSVSALYTASWSPFAGQLALFQPSSGQDELLQSETFGTDSNVASLDIIVPIATAERFAEIASFCNAPASLTAVAEDASLMAQSDVVQSEALLAQLDALADDAIPPGCEADLRAIAEAMASS